MKLSSEKLSPVAYENKYKHQQPNIFENTALKLISSSIPYPESPGNLTEEKEKRV